jgi:hypothetical protein
MINKEIKMNTEQCGQGAVITPEKRGYKELNST